MDAEVEYSIKCHLYFDKKGKRVIMNMRTDTESLRRAILYWLLEETKLVDEQGNIYITMAPKEFRRSFHQLRFGKTRRIRLRNLRRCLEMFKVDEDGDIIVLP